MPRRITLGDDWWDRLGGGASRGPSSVPGLTAFQAPGFDPTRSGAIRVGMEYARSRGKHVGRPATVSALRVLELTAQGQPVRAIADQLGCSVDAVRRVLRRH